MHTEKMPSEEIVNISITTENLATTSATDLNTIIRNSESNIFMIYQGVGDATLPLEEAVSIIKNSNSIEMIQFTKDPLPLLFTRNAWKRVNGIQQAEGGADNIVSAFIESARKYRRFTIIQIYK